MGSGSTSLYGGARRSPADVFRTIMYQSNVQPPPGYPGPPLIGEPLTGAVQLVWMTDESLNLTPGANQVNNVRWGAEHFGTVMRLYQDHLRDDPDYITGSYDYYSLYFVSSSTNVVATDLVDRTYKTVNYPTASFAVEAWIKPFQTGSASTSYTIANLNTSFWFGITGSSGHLAFTSSIGQVVTSSVDLLARRWNHVAFCYDSVAQSGTFYVNLQPAGIFQFPSASIATGNGSHGLSFGNRITVASDVGPTASVGDSLAFHGMMGECRFWDSVRPFALLSASYNTRLTGSQQLGPRTLLQFNEGPQSSLMPLVTPGSGVINYAEVARYPTSSHTYGSMNGFSDRLGPTWLPSDNVYFYPTKALAPVVLSGTWGNNRSDDVHRMLVVNVPAGIYGRWIVPNSLRIEDRAYSDPSRGLVRVLVDDGRGNLYVSGSMTSSSLANKEDYAGVGWNKVGNVFYGEGLVVIRDPSLLDVGRTDAVTAHPNDTFALSFRGQSRVPVKTLMCRIGPGEFNATLNPTYLNVDPDDGSWTVRHVSESVRCSTIGLYNSDRKLVAVARLADPPPVGGPSRLLFRLRIDF